MELHLLTSREVGRWIRSCTSLSASLGRLIYAMERGLGCEVKKTWRKDGGFWCPIRCFHGLLHGKPVGGEPRTSLPHVPHLVGVWRSNERW